MPNQTGATIPLASVTFGQQQALRFDCRLDPRGRFDRPRRRWLGCRHGSTGL